MLRCKPKKHISLVLTIVLLVALMLQNLVTIPQYIASVSASVSTTDISAEEQGAEENVPGASPDEPGALEDGAQKGANDQVDIPFKAPLRQFIANTFPYTTTAGQSKTFAELFSELGISNSVDDIQSVSPTSNDKLGLDVTGGKITPKRYGTVEMVNFNFKDGTGIQVEFTDSSFVRNIEPLCTGVKLLVNGKYYSADDAGATISVSGKKYYDLMVDFAETPDLQFSNYKTLYYDLPQGFRLPADFNETNHTVDIAMGPNGKLKGNTVTFERGSTQDRIYIKWNQDDPKTFAAFCESMSTKFTLVLSGLLDPNGGKLIFETGKELTLEKEDLHNATISKEASYLPGSNPKIFYDLVLTSDGSTQDLVLTDVMGRALKKAEEVSIEYQADANATTPLTNEQKPYIHYNEKGKLVIKCPKLNDGDVVTVRYTCQVDCEQIEQSGHATEEETGNTATIVGDDDPSDNVAQAHVTNVTFGDINKISEGKMNYKQDGYQYAVINWYAETNFQAALNLAGTFLTDKMGDYSEISVYHGDGVKIECRNRKNELVETRSLTWEDLGIDPATDKSWTYHIPEDDPIYEYRVRYQTRVLRDGLENQILVTNTVTGKCGTATGMEPVDPLGPSGFAISKSVSDLKYDHATWNVNLSVSGEENLDNRIKVVEYASRNSEGLPRLWIPLYTDNKGQEQGSINISEWLETLVVSGLMPNEQFRLEYKYNDCISYTNGRTETLVIDSNNAAYATRSGDTVTVTGFPYSPGYRYEANYLSISFYKDDSKDVNGNFANQGLNLPAEPDPLPKDYLSKRSIDIKMTTRFDDRWVNTVRKYSEEITKPDTNSDYPTDKYTHTNWVKVFGENEYPKASDDAYFITHPINLYKRLLNSGTATSRNPLATDEKGDPILTNTGEPIYYPVYQYYVAVNGVSSDDPLVIEDSFDTSLFTLFDASKFHCVRKKNGNVYDGIDCYVQVEGYETEQDDVNERYPDHAWINWLYPTFAGQNDIRNATPSETYGKALRIYEDTIGGVEATGEQRRTIRGANNTNEQGFRVMESDHMLVEETATGARFTFKDMNFFKKDNGNYYPFYVVNYYLMPRNLKAIAELERMVIDNGNNPAAFSNTASCRGNTASAIAYYTKKNSLKPVTKNYTYDEEYSTELQPRYNFSIDINPYRLKMNEGGEMTVKDVYSDTLSVDYESISFVTDPPEAVNQIHYDYRGNTGYFYIPDETHVIITYRAAVVRKEDSTTNTVSFSNNVSVLGYSSGVEESTEISSSSHGQAENASLMLFKYCSGHMEKGLNGAKFQLYQAVTDEQGNLQYDSNNKLIKTPMKGLDGKDIVFESGKSGKDGYVQIKLTADDHGQNLKTGKTYVLCEKEAPSGFSKDEIEYRFTINKDGTVNYDDYHYLDGDVLKIRNTPEAVDFIVTKEVKGNVTLTSEDKENIEFKLEKWNTQTKAWEVYIPAGETVSSYSGIPYSAFTDSQYTFSGLTQGKYRLIESDEEGKVRAAHTGSRFSASMLMDDNVGCSVSDTNSTTCNSIQIEFDITQAQLQSANPRTVKVTNTYSVATVDKKVIKRWYNADGTTEINWPTGLKVQLDIYRYEPATGQTEGSVVQSITLDGVADQNGEFIPGQATFLNLPQKKEVVKDGVTTLENQIYAVKEASTFNGYQPENNDPVKAFYNTSTSQSTDSLTFKNIKQSTSFSVKKVWTPEKPANPSATFRLFYYTGTDVSKAKMVEDMDLPRPDPSSTHHLSEEEKWTAVFENLPSVNDQDVPLNYIAKEISCTPGYEASYAGNGSFAVNEGVITNKPAKTDFNVTVQWEQLSGDEWPKGIKLNLPLRRRPKGVTDPETGEPAGPDDHFRMTLSLPGTETDLVETQSNELGTDPEEKYTVKRKKRSAVKYQLEVEELDKFYTDENGNLVEWEYYVEQVVYLNGSSVYQVSDVSTSYANHNRAPLDGLATNRGLITNRLPTGSLLVSKHVEGTFASHYKYFNFKIILGSANAPVNGAIPCQIRSDHSDTDNITVTFTNGEANVKLRHGETLVIPNLTLGTPYSITETTVSGYSPTVTDDAGRVENSNTVSGEVSNNASAGENQEITVSFLNKRNGTVDTGVTVGLTGAGVVLLLSVGAFLLLLRKKAKTHQEADEG